MFLGYRARAEAPHVRSKQDTPCVAYAMLVKNITSFEPLHTYFYSTYEEAFGAWKEWLLTHVHGDFEIMGLDELYDREFEDILNAAQLCERYRLGSFPEVGTSCWPVKDWAA